MRKHRFTTLLLTAIMSGRRRCAPLEPKNSGPPTKRVTTDIPQTGSIVGRRVEVVDLAEAPEGNQPAKEKPAKAKPKSATVSDDVVTRGGFR